MTMATYTDEDLVSKYRETSDETTRELTFGELYERYESMLDTMSKSYYSKNRYLTLEDWASYVHEYFVEAARKYRPGAMPFKSFVRLVVSRRKGDLIRTMRYSYQTKEAQETGRFALKDAVPVDVVSLDDVAERGADNRSFEFHEVVEDAKARIDVQLRETHTPLFDFIRTKSLEAAKFLELHMGGYSYVEIGKTLGRQGTTNALNCWGKRTLDRLQALAVDFYASNGAIEEIRPYVPSVPTPPGDLLQPVHP